MPDERTSVPHLLLCSDREALSVDAACRFVALASEASRNRRPFSVALAGGRTPEALYRLLAQPPFQDAIDWQSVHLFFGDERYVPIDSEFSNYRMALNSLIAPANLSSDHIHPIPTDQTDIDAAVRMYEEELSRFFGSTCLPRFDLVLLGMGPDGHCASLFPHKPALSEASGWVVATEPGLEPFVPRITLTLPVLNNAANVLFMATGADKADTVARVLNGPNNPQELPSQSVRPVNGSLTWLLDRAAGSKLFT